MQEDPEEAQRERATQAWQLVVLDEASAPVLKALRKILRVKRSEIAAVTDALPGPVRRGARVDLAPFAELLEEAGVRAELRRSDST